jgi:large subunit ribosomal protein L10
LSQEKVSLSLLHESLCVGRREDFLVLTLYKTRRWTSLAISKEKKQELVKSYTEEFSRSQAAILTDYRGLPVTELNRLRNKMREAESGYHVVKNRLVKLALREAGLPVPEELLQGPTAIGFCYEDVVAPAKVLTDYAKESKVLTIKGGILGERVIDVQDISALADLPPRDVLLAQLLSSIQSPMAGLINVLNGTLRSLVTVLKARADQLEAGNA